MINDRVVILDVSVQVQRRIQEGEWMKCSSDCAVFFVLLFQDLTLKCRMGCSISLHVMHFR